MSGIAPPTNLDLPGGNIPMKVSMYGQWCSIVQRPHHLAELLAQRSHSLDVFTVKRHRYNAPKLDFDYRLFKRTQLPGPLNKISYLDKLVARYDAEIEHRVCSDFLASEADVSIYYGRPLDLSDKPFTGGQFIYDCVDDFEGFDGKQDPQFQRWEQELCEKADQIWVVSRCLQEKLSAFSDKVRYVPNGVNYDHYAGASALRLEADGNSARRPCLIYVGAIYSWFDAPLVGELAALMPDWDIKLVGPVELSPTNLDHLNKPNVEFLGVQNYLDLPALMATANVAMIPFLLNRLTAATSPLKLYEYLAAGLPVVASPMAEVVPYQEPGVVMCKESPREFAEAVREIHQNLNAQRCEEIARLSSWSERFRPVLDELGI